MRSCSQGHTYERATIEDWFRKRASWAPGEEIGWALGATGLRTCPMTRQPVPQVLVRNIDLEKAIRSWVTRQDTWDELAMFSVVAPRQA